MVEAFSAIEAYLLEPDTDLKDLILFRDHEFVRRVQEYRGTRLSPLESQTLAAIDADFAQALVLGRGVMDLTDTLRGQVVRFEGTLVEIDHILGDDIDGLLRQRVALAEEDAVRAGRLATAVGLGSGLFVILLVAAMGRTLATGIIGTAAKLAGGATEYGRGNFDHRIEVQQEDELGELATAFNDMADGLKRGELRFQAVVEATPTALVMVDGTGTITQVNAEAESCFGYERDEMVGKPLQMLLPGGARGGHAGLPGALSEDATAQSKHPKRDLMGHHKDGTIFPIELGSRPLVLEDRPIVLYAVLDITDRRAMEASARQQQKLEVIGTLAGGIAHDFNNILTAVMGFLDLAMHSIASGTEPYQHLSEVKKASSRAKDLVAQILAISRPGDQELRPIKLHLVVQEALSLLRESIPTTISFREHISADCGLVLADASQIHQVTLNLCTNAAHAMREQGGTLTVRVEETRIEDGAGTSPEGLERGRYVRLTVRDTGHGMDEDTKARIFEPYFSTKEVGEGTGLGLATVLAIVEDHDGAVTVQSRPGQGTEFGLYFPVHTGTQDVSADGDSEATPALPGNGEHILFGDDELPIVAAYEIILRKYGYRVTACGGSTEAFEAFRGDPERFDMVITDQTMPEMTGLDMAKKVLRIRSGIPILLCTGYSATVDEAVALGAGLRGYVPKPIRAADLARTIRQAFDEPARDAVGGAGSSDAPAPTA